MEHAQPRGCRGAEPEQDDPVGKSAGNLDSDGVVCLDQRLVRTPPHTLDLLFVIQCSPFVLFTTDSLVQLFILKPLFFFLSFLLS